MDGSFRGVAQAVAAVSQILQVKSINSRNAAIVNSQGHEPLESRHSRPRAPTGR
jgi:hypothetical protein